MRKSKQVAFEEFIKKSGIKDRMAASFFYAFYVKSGLGIEEWLGKKTKKPLSP